MRALIVVKDLMARSRLAEAAAAAGYEVTTVRAVPPPPPPPPPPSSESSASSASSAEGVPDIMVVDLDLEGALESVVAWREAHPGARLVGFAFHAEEELIASARAAGVEVVPHGATARPARIFS